MTVHWYVVPKSNPVLPYPSRINSLCWRDQQVNPSPVGEVSVAEQTFDGWNRIVPPLPQDHICGTREDFEFGGLRDTDQPPLVRADDGIPTCCRDPLGGLLLGGESPVVVGAAELGGGTFAANAGPLFCAGGCVISVTGVWWLPFVGGFATTAERFANLTGLQVGRTYRLMAAESGDGYGQLDIRGGGGCGAHVWSITAPGPGSWDVTFTVPPGSPEVHLAWTWLYAGTGHDAGPLSVMVLDVTP